MGIIIFITTALIITILAMGSFTICRINIVRVITAKSSKIWAELGARIDEMRKK
jgi:hypothetical protein